MHILLWKWNSYMIRGVIRGLEENKITYDTFTYQLSNWEEDDEFCTQLESKLQKEKYDAVFSINYTPLITKVCENQKLQYISWIYDSPLHIRKLDSLKSEYCNVFIFDKGLVQTLQQRGCPVHYAPLAGDVTSFSNVLVTLEEQKKYQAQVSLVGNLYQTDFAYYMSPLSEEIRGYWQGVVAAQSKVYGAYFIPELITEDRMQKLNACYEAASNGTVKVEPRELEFLLAGEITGRERYIAVSLLDKYFNMKLYASSIDEHLSAECQMGAVDYYTQMPKIFKSSDINLNISLKAIQTGIPLRVFDVMSSGGFLLSNYQQEMEEYFNIGTDFIVYNDLEEMVSFVDYYLNHPKERCQIAENGMKRMENDYTFAKAIKQIFTKANS